MSTLKIPDQVPTPVEDCEKLKKAFVGLGTDEASIINVLSHRNASQRKLIRQTYAEKYGEDLLIDLQKEISGDFERAVHLWTIDPIERDVLLATEAINKKKKKKNIAGHYVIMEIACTRTSHEVLLVRQSYMSRFRTTLEEDVAHHSTDDDFRKFLLPLVTAYRYEGPEINMTLANSEAKILHQRISSKAYNHDEFIRIFTTRSKPQINATLNQYKDQFGKSINKDIKQKAAGDEFLKFLRAIIKCLTLPQKYFEKALRLSMKGLGTDEEVLTRVVITRADVDMKQIMEEYQRRNTESLEIAIKGDTSGDYRTMLLSLIGC